MGKKRGYEVSCIKRGNEDADTFPQSNLAWLEQEREKWRWFELTSANKAQVDELNDILTRHNLSRRELAVITETLQLRPEFTLDDFRADQDLLAPGNRKRLIQMLLDFVEQTVKGGGLLESNVKALPGVAAVLAKLLEEEW